MRAYFWGNYYLSSIQQGIQALHTTAEMFVKYRTTDPSRSQMVHDWAEYHKTVVVLNAGDHDALQGIAQDFNDPENTYPWATFVEEGIGHNLTCIGIVVDERIVEAVNEVRSARKERRRFNFPTRLNTFDYELVMLIANTNMAR